MPFQQGIFPDVTHKVAWEVARDHDGKTTRSPRKVGDSEEFSNMKMIKITPNDSFANKPLFHRIVSNLKLSIRQTKKHMYLYHVTLFFHGSYWHEFLEDGLFNYI